MAKKITILLIKQAKCLIYIYETIQNAIAICVGNPPKIGIVRSFWNNFTDIERLILVYHELGHCALHRNHTIGILEDNCPDSIMYPTFIGRECFDKHYTYYLEELRN